MKDQPGTAAGTRPFEINRIDLRAVPGQSSLFLDFLHDQQRVSKFYPGLERGLEDVAKEVLDSYAVDRPRLCAMLESLNREFGGSEQTISNIERLRSENTVAVMTGQQAGLFSGPAYTIYKAVSAIRLARDLSDTGIAAVPVFWIASEDHDLEEVSETWFPVGDEGILRLAYESGSGDASMPVGSVRFGRSISDIVDQASEILTGCGSTEAAANLLKECYSEEETFSSAFGRLLLRIFGRHGLIVASPMEPEFRALASPIVGEAVKNASGIGDKLRRRDAELEKEGYHSQVHVGEDYFPFFLIEGDGRRVPLRLDGSEAVRRQDTDDRILLSDLLSDLEQNASILSPNAIMRPVVQDFVFPNICYFGGSAEVAYFAQNSAVYELLERPTVPIRHRASFTILEPRNRRTLKSYSMGFEDILRGKEHVAGEVKEQFLYPETAEAFRNTRAEFNNLIDGLESRLLKSDPTLAESLAKRRKKILWHIETLHSKFLRSEAFKDDVAARRLAFLFSTALPNDALQERTVNFLYFYALFGDRLIDWLIESAAEKESEHTILVF